MKKQFLSLFEYTHYANGLYIELLENENIASQRMLQLFSHILNAQQIWLDRVGGVKSVVVPWQEHSINAFASMNDVLWEATKKVILQEDFERIIAYENSKKVAYENTIADVFWHIVNHSTYHRAQIAILVRAEGENPPNSDYIFFKRNKQSE